jgi:hypothetical protein
MNRLDEEDHGELGMDDRLLDVDDVQASLEEKLRHLRDNSNLILSDHRDDIEIFFLRKRPVLPFH